MPCLSARGTPPPALVLDACILMSGVLRPTLLDMAELGWFRPIWSERIGVEWRRNAARLWGVDPAVLTDEWQRMNQRFPRADAGDVTPYLAGLRESDAKDWHVIAAGLAARARRPGEFGEVSVLTWNLKDFRRAELRRLSLQLTDPDRLLSAWWQAEPEPLRLILARTLDNLARDGRPRSGSLFDVMRRERLFRLARLAEAPLDRAA
ncbi:MAG: PIN domain-containing protein [Pigmentiphaga sp.]